MKDTKNSMKQNNSLRTQDEKTVEVLYQKMGDRWFAFSLIDDEVFVGSITQNEIDVPLEARDTCPNLEEMNHKGQDGFDHSV